LVWRCKSKFIDNSIENSINETESKYTDYLTRPSKFDQIDNELERIDTDAPAIALLPVDSSREKWNRIN
jgi:hypothetical protein